ncbi:helix-turn-helix domain-containing protein [Oliverpabstia intestinalis]|uniref:helix-turn-helix domain-containing protein n=1 Tax=Oliverpabstia intestinalis TaxID=2606633 RepID=UPI003F8CEA29
MYVKLTTQEKLKDLRVARKLTLKQLEAEVGIASSTLGEYENNDYKDITSHSLEVLAKFYGVSVDYLLGITENNTEANTPLEELHLTDKAVAVLKSGKINTRLLSEMIAHPAFRKMMTDSEIYVDRIAAGRIHDMNIMLEAVRQTMITEKGADPDDIYMQTIKAAQLSEDDFFGTAINKDMMEILSSIRDAHMTDSTTADITGADVVKNALDQANHFEGSAEEAKVAMFLGQLGIKYNKITKDEFVTLMGILRKSDLLKSPGNKRGKGGKKRK